MKIIIEFDLEDEYGDPEDDSGLVEEDYSALVQAVQHMGGDDVEITCRRDTPNE